MIDIFEHPLKLLKDLEQLYIQIRQIVADNSDLIEITNDEVFNIAKKRHLTNSKIPQAELFFFENTLYNRTLKEKNIGNIKGSVETLLHLAYLVLKVKPNLNDFRSDY